MNDINEQELIVELIQKDIRKRKFLYYVNQFIFGPMSIAWMYIGATQNKGLFLIGGFFWFIWIMIDQCFVIKHQLMEFNKCLDVVKAGKITTVKQFEKFVQDQIDKNNTES